MDGGAAALAVVATAIGTVAAPAGVHAAPIATRTTISTSPNPSKVGDLVEVTVSVRTSEGFPAEGGVVTVHYNNGSSRDINLSGGQASDFFQLIPVGTQIITADYRGTVDFAASTATLDQTVNQANTTTTLTSSPEPGVHLSVGDVQGGGGWDGRRPDADGNRDVRYRRHPAVLGPVRHHLRDIFREPQGGPASAVGTHTVVATYNGDESYLASTSNTLIHDQWILYAHGRATSCPPIVLTGSPGHRAQRREVGHRVRTR